MRKLVPMSNAALLLSLSLLTSCGDTGRGTDVCLPWRPILVSKKDVLTEDTARQILTHNETGRTVCKWQPNKP